MDYIFEQASLKSDVQNYGLKNFKIRENPSEIELLQILLTTKIEQ